jgi:hypothetical protein
MIKIIVRNVEAITFFSEPTHKGYAISIPNFAKIHKKFMPLFRRFKKNVGNFCPDLEGT